MALPFLSSTGVFSVLKPEGKRLLLVDFREGASVEHDFLTEHDFPTEHDFQTEHHFPQGMISRQNNGFLLTNVCWGGKCPCCAATLGWSRAFAWPRKKTNSLHPVRPRASVHSRPRQGPPLQSHFVVFQCSTFVLVLCSNQPTRVRSTRRYISAQRAEQGKVYSNERKNREKSRRHKMRSLVHLMRRKNPATSFRQTRPA